MTPSRQFVFATVLAALFLIAAAILARNAVQTASVRAPAVDPAALTQADEDAALKAAEPIDPAMITYHEAGSFAVALHEPRTLAVDSQGEIYVGGDRAVERYTSGGKRLAVIALEGEPRCLAVGASDHAKPGQIYVGLEDHIEVHGPNSARIAVWRSPLSNAFFTSLATTENEVWVADAGNRLVWRFDLDGKLLDPPVGKEDPSHNWPGFLVTNHYFDVAAGIDGLVYIVNPRLLRVDGFMRNGKYEITWGKGSPSVKDFFGCCNPAQLAVLPDGRFVTAEKGMPRVKIYAGDGTFQTVVAGPSQLTGTPADLAADRRGRVLVLDGRAAKVRIFVTNAGDRGKNK
jgi:hypothetical protein